MLRGEHGTPQDTKAPAGPDDPSEHDQQEGNKHSRDPSPLPNATNGGGSDQSTGSFLRDISNNGGDGASEAGKLFENLTLDPSSSSGGVKEREGLFQFGAVAGTASGTGFESQKVAFSIGIGSGHTASNDNRNPSRQSLSESDLTNTTSTGDGSQETENFFRFGNIRDSGDNARIPENLFRDFDGNTGNSGIRRQKVGGFVGSSKRAIKATRISRRKSPKSLLSLNSTLLTAVFRHLSMRNLARLCGVSKHFKAVIEPILYEEIKLSPVFVGKPPEKSCCLLLRSIINRPALASYIKSLKLWGKEWTGDQESGLPWGGKFYTVWWRGDATSMSFSTVGGLVERSIFYARRVRRFGSSRMFSLFPGMGYNIFGRAGKRQ